MATTPTPTHPLFATPLYASTDFTILAAHSYDIADELLECQDTTLHLALCARLSACLSLLRPTLLDPVPAHLVESLTTDTPPEIAPALEADTEQLCDYVLALSHLLTCQTPPGQMAKPLTGLMADLTSLLARKLLAPRWIRATNGSEFIEYK